MPRRLNKEEWAKLKRAFVFGHSLGAIGIRALCGQGTFRHSCAGIARLNLGHRAKKLGSTIWRSIVPWKKRLVGARSIATGSPSVVFPTGASYALSLGLANGDVFSFVIAFSPGFIVRARARGRIGNNNEIQIPMVYIAHGVGDNVLPIGSTSRVFVSSLRKNGYKVEFREFSGGHHVSRQVVDQAMSWLTSGFHQRR